MGMYDQVKCLYPLSVEGANERDYQTKDLNCFLDNYEIREDGRLWHQEYEVEDHSDPNAEGWRRLSGMMTRVEKRWEPCAYTGEIRFYDSIEKTHPYRGWIEWSAYFHHGTLKELHLVKHELPENEPAA